eukprot:Rmarinus@m.15267
MDADDVTGDLFEKLKTAVNLLNEGSDAFSENAFERAMSLYEAGVEVMSSIPEEMLDLIPYAIRAPPHTLTLQFVVSLLNLSRCYSLAGSTDLELKTLDHCERIFSKFEGLRSFAPLLYFQCIQKLSKAHEALGKIREAYLVLLDVDEPDVALLAAHKRRLEQILRETADLDTLNALGISLCEDNNDCEVRSDVMELLHSSGSFGPASRVYPKGLVKLLRARETTFQRIPCQVFSRDIFPQSPARTVLESQARAYCGKFSQDGSLFYSAYQNWEIYVMDTDDPTRPGKPVAYECQRGRWTITDAVMSKDNDMLLYSSITPYVYIFKKRYDGEGYDHCDTPLCLNEGGVWAIRLSDDKREVLAGTTGCGISVCDVETMDVVFSVRGHQDDVNSVAFGGSGSNVVLSGSDDGFIKIWDRRTMLSSEGVPAGVFVGHRQGVTCVSPKGDDLYFVSNAKDQTLRLWDIRKALSHTQFEQSPQLPLFFEREGWDYRTGFWPGMKWKDSIHPNDCSVLTCSGHSVLSTLIRCDFSPALSTGQRYLYTGSKGGCVHIYDLSGKAVQVLPLSGGDIDDLDVSFAGPWDVSDGNSIIRDVSWHPHLPVLYCTSWNGTLSMFGHCGWSGRDCDD